MNTTNNPRTLRTLGRPRLYNYAEIAKDRQNGMSWDELKIKYNCHDETIARALREWNAIKTVRRVDTEKIVSLYAEGYSAPQVAGLLNCNPITVYTHLRRAGVKARNRGCYRRETVGYALTDAGQEIAKELS